MFLGVRFSLRSVFYAFRFLLGLWSSYILHPFPISIWYMCCRRNFKTRFPGKTEAEGTTQEETQWLVDFPAGFPWQVRSFYVRLPGYVRVCGFVCMQNSLQTCVYMKPETLTTKVSPQIQNSESRSPEWRTSPSGGTTYIYTWWIIPKGIRNKQLQMAAGHSGLAAKIIKSFAPTIK